MLRAETEAQAAIDKWEITHPFWRDRMYTHLLHIFKLTYGEYPRLPRKFKKKHPEYNISKIRSRLNDH